MRFKSLLIISVFIIFFTFSVSAALNISLSKQGSNVRTISDGELLSVGNLTIEVWDSLTGGNLIYNETFENAIVNGSWSVMIGENSSNPLSLNYGEIYYYDYKINGNDINFTTYNGTVVERQFFYSPLGDIGGEYISSSANLTLGQKIVFALGGFIQNIISGQIDVNGTLNVTNNLSVGENLDVTGNLGIGESNVTSKLHVSLGNANTSWSPISTLATFESNTHTFIDLVGDNIAGIKFSDNEAHAVGGVHYDHAENLLSLIADSTEVMWLNGSGSGRIGIGDSTPESTLDAVGIYSDIVGGTNRDLYIDNAGVIGYVSSSKRYKSNILDLPDSSWIYDLRPVSFIRNSDGTKDMGLIAEEVHEVNPDLVSYDLFEQVNETYVKVEDRDEHEGYVELDRNMTSEDVWEVTLGKNVTVEHTNVTTNETYETTKLDTDTKIIAKLPETVQYSKLIIPLLKAIQELRKDVDSLTRGNYTFEEEVVFDEDMVGTAVVGSGELEVEVKFKEKYGVVPVVTLTAKDFIDGQYKVSNETIKGFVIELQKTQEKEVKFNWHAFAVKSKLE